MLSASAFSNISQDIAKELNKQEQEEAPFQGFILSNKNTKFNTGITQNWEWDFLVPMEYNGNKVYYVPKSYVERGYAWTNPATG